MTFEEAIAEERETEAIARELAALEQRHGAQAAFEEARHRLDRVRSVLLSRLVALLLTSDETVH